MSRPFTGKTVYIHTNADRRIFKSKMGKAILCHRFLKILSVEMDLTKSGIIRKAFIKGRGAEISIQ